MSKLHDTGKVTALFKSEGGEPWLITNIKIEHIKHGLDCYVYQSLDLKVVDGELKSSSTQVNTLMESEVNTVGIYKKENVYACYGKFVMFRDGGFIIFDSLSNHAQTTNLFDYRYGEVLFAGFIEVEPSGVHTFGSSLSLGSRSSAHSTDERLIATHFGIMHRIKPAAQLAQVT